MRCSDSACCGLAASGVLRCAAGASVSGESASEPGQPIPASVYEAWKGRLPPACGKIIDALLVQPLSSSQMVTYCKMHYNTVINSLTILRKNGLVEKDGNLHRLKRP